MGKEFIELFDHWADTYDHTVDGHDVEYREVFENYEEILTLVSEKVKGNVLEFGVGTGNLTKKLISKAEKVYGVEPSEMMRKKALGKVPEINLLEGDFLDFPEIPGSVDTIVSSWAFHHLTDEEKLFAIQKYVKILPLNGKIIFVDTIFRDDLDRKKRWEFVEQQGFFNLLKDLKTEYYTTIEVLEPMFIANGFKVSFTKLNNFVWLIDATKKGLDRNE